MFLLYHARERLFITVVFFIFSQFVQLEMSSDVASISQHSPEYLRQYNGNPLYVISELFIVLEILSVTLRFYSRKIKGVPLGADDVLIVTGMVFGLAICACSLGTCHSDKTNLGVLNLNTF